MADRSLEFRLTTQRHSMASKQQARGTKRTCQNTACGQRFYDLERDPIMCPMCGSAYNISVSPAAIAAAAAEEKAARKAAKKPVFVEPEAVTDEAALVEGAEALPEIEGEEEPAAGEADETFLEEEEETGDVSTIIGDVAEGEEEV
jgi:uncharacterized protein (TIGR02300 family)